VPVEQQFALFAKILTFDKNLKDRVGKEMVLAIIYQNNFKSSFDTKNVLEKTIDLSPIKTVLDIPLRTVAIDIENEIDLESALKRNNISVAYIAPLRAASLNLIISRMRQLQIRTLTGVPDYVNSGLAIGIGSKGGKPEILVNLAASKLEGANFNSQLLKLAKIIK
jgi:hypothetical protein